MTAHFIWNLQKHRNVQNRKIADVRMKQDQKNISATFGNIGKVEMCRIFKTWIFKTQN